MVEAEPRLILPALGMANNLAARNAKSRLGHEERAKGVEIPAHWTSIFPREDLLRAVKVGT